MTKTIQRKWKPIRPSILIELQKCAKAAKKDGDVVALDRVMKAIKILKATN